MSFFKFTKGLLAGSILAFGLTACTTDDSDDGIIIPVGYKGSSAAENGDSESSSSLTQGVPKELQYNYELLAYYYFYAHLNNEISDDVLDYYQAPVQESYGLSWCTIDYSDVCYMYSQMSDPFTRYYDPYYAAYVLNYLSQSEEEVGIGADLDYLEDKKALAVMEVYSGYSAEEAGLAVNDTIVGIRGALPSTEDAAKSLLSGDEGTNIDLLVKRGEDTLSMTVTLAAYNMPTVKLRYRDSIPVINITEFTSKTSSDSGTYGEFVQALKKTEGAKATIIDLRGNPGGDVDQCNAISAEILNKGDTIIVDIETGLDSVLQGKEFVYEQVFDTIAYTVDVDGSGRDRYYVFLADSNSASCAEVLLSAATVNKKSPVVGLTTYGKGIGQLVAPTWDNGLGLVTALQSMDREGNVYHKVGIVPDYITGDRIEQMAKAVEWAKAGTMVRTAGYGTESTGHFARAKPKVPNYEFPKNRKDFLRSLPGKISIRNR